MEQKPTNTAKQWKQRLQFELQGADYNSLIFNSHEDIQILPFYTSQNESIHYPINTTPQVLLPLYASNAEQTLNRIDFWLRKSVVNFCISIHPEIENIELLFNNLPAKGNYIFLFSKQLPASVRHSNCVFLPDDVIASFLKTGKWTKNAVDDLKKHREQCLTHGKPSLLVDSSLYQNAGCSIIQQIAYTMAHTVSYLEEIQFDTNTKKVKLYVQTAVGSHFLLETCKLRALRQVMDSVLAVFPFQIDVFFIAEPSHRGLSLLKTKHNENYIDLAYESAIIGGSDFILPKNESCYKKNTTENQHLHIEKINKILPFRKACFLNEMPCFETITYEIAKKSLLAFQHIEKTGGLLQHAHNHILQKKIKEKAKQQVIEFNNQLPEEPFTNDLFALKNEWELYPFVKQKHEKTHIEPLIIKRLWENIEKKK
ncbi:methylmalonyl-CoA mutase family protein [Capnocytophaga sp.]|uniref:methylmalonyl-CoA mutase family protein n=1 Tax=Capnocytophaga sp. TaxID=44737 RepID=UPI0026DBE1EA|nr:methylmalonyl-CoA mutase family protein [Capnocytophaga sp.]MDO5105594.1 methylmalonyl-CoA mutase family protein [Capnocytophaga sp.]